MGDEVVTTGVDELITLLRGKEKMPLLDVATELHVTPEILQSWVDFLVEEGIIGIEYKFTKPFIYLNNEEDVAEGDMEEKGKIVKEEELGWTVFKKVFFQKAQDKGLPQKKIGEFWRHHVLSVLENKKRFFYDEARLRALKDIDLIWQQYKEDLLTKI